MRAWCWLALVPDGPPPDADASARLSELDDEPAGWLAAWRGQRRPRRDARRGHAAVLDGGGGPALLSLVLPPAGVRLAFDDVAVQQARRAVLAGPPADVLTTLLSDASHFEGALTARRGRDALRLLREDPFARIFPARLLRAEEGLLGTMPAPAGPVIERYGSARPWPWDRYSS